MAKEFKNIMLKKANKYDVWCGVPVIFCPAKYRGVATACASKQLAHLMKRILYTVDNVLYNK
ncbi:MAG: hypothetical protein ACI4TZ_04180 [Christensenellales bacterium]